jgi:hypothetical protein
MVLPDTLHAQLYLLAYDRHRHRFCFDREVLFGFALRAAMLTDLYLGGLIHDLDGKPCRTVGTRVPSDPVLYGIWKHLGTSDWACLIGRGERDSRCQVRDQLMATGWLHAERHRVLGLIPSDRLCLRDEDAVSDLGERVAAALHAAIAGLPASPRPLALGLLGVLGQVPTVLSFDECSQYRFRLRALTFASIEPILGLHQAIERHHTEMRSQMGFWGE